MRGLSVTAVVIFLAFFFVCAPAAICKDSSPIDEVAQELASRLNQHLTSGPPRHPRTLVVNLVDVNQLFCTSKFGQIVSERLKVYLQGKGWDIVEPRRGLTVKLQRNVGEFNLSDRVKDLASQVDCDAVLDGTYMFHKGSVMINVHLIRLTDNKIISSAACELPADPWISPLLSPIGFGCKAPKAFLKIEAWKSPSYDRDLSELSNKEEQYYDDLD